LAAPLSERIVRLLKCVPKGKIATYGHIAALAGDPRGARQVVRILHSSSDKEKLPWHRIINSRGKISLPRGSGYELQKALLEKEGIVFSLNSTIDLEKYLWWPRRKSKS
jgi:methylated-DNA-protein-cysteine methyltransferase-like protein